MKSKIEEPAIELTSTKEYLKSAEAVSDYIKELPLTTEQNDKLIQLLHAHVYAARAGALGQGLAMVLKAESKINLPENLN